MTKFFEKYWMHIALAFAGALTIWFLYSSGYIQQWTATAKGALGVGDTTGPAARGSNTGNSAPAAAVANLCGQDCSVGQGI